MITCGDFLAGGGGVTEAMSQIPCLEPKFVLNHDPIAIRTNLFHHNKVKHYRADMYHQKEHEIDRVDFVWASVECTQFSKAKGGASKDIGSYMLGFELIRYIRYIDPFVIGIENVPEFKDWSRLRVKEDKKLSKKRKYSALKMEDPNDPNSGYMYEGNKNFKGEMFEKWKAEICGMGYEYTESIRNAADDGLPTRRVRYFAFFYKPHLGLDMSWPTYTHNKDGSGGLKKWEPCRPYINTEDEGESIFGRKYNIKIAKGHRKPLCKNTLTRIAGGIKKEAPEMHFIMQYYGSGLNVQGLEKPLNTIVTKERHALVKVETNQFVADHCHTDNFHSLNDPLNPQLSRQTKQLITLEKIQFLQDYYGRDNAISCEKSKRQVTAETKFISVYNNSNGSPEYNNVGLDEPIWALTTEEKFQFVSAYFNSSGNPGSQNQSLDKPLGTILSGTNKKALITALKNGEINFDIKMRFLTPDELAAVSTFPNKYFSNPRLKLNKKQQTALIGKAVPPQWAKKIIQPIAEQLNQILNSQIKSA